MPVLGLVTIGSLIISVDQIKETIMKIIIFWTALISVLALFIGACAKRDDTTFTATAVSCDRTASGSITVGSDTVSSSYLMFTGSTPVTGCIDMTGRSTEGLPNGTQSIKQ